MDLDDCSNALVLTLRLLGLTPEFPAVAVATYTGRNSQETMRTEVLDTPDKFLSSLPFLLFSPSVKDVYLVSGGKM